MPGGNVVGIPGKPKGQTGGRGGGPLVFAFYILKTTAQKKGKKT